MAGEGVNVANAYVQIIPSAQGVKQNITDALVPDLTAAGQQGGDALGGGLMSTLQGSLGKIAGAVTVNRKQSGVSVTPSAQPPSHTLFSSVLCVGNNYRDPHRLYYWWEIFFRFSQSLYLGISRCSKSRVHG